MISIFFFLVGVKLSQQFDMSAQENEKKNEIKNEQKDIVKKNRNT